MSTITTHAPICFAAQALAGSYGQPGVEYIAVGTPDLSQVAPGTEKVDWNGLSRFGAPAALQVAPETFVEVRALRGSYFNLFERRTGETHTWAAGAFLFPANKPMLLGGYKLYQHLEWDGDFTTAIRSGLAIASIGRKGTLAAYHSDKGRAGRATAAARIPFISCIGLAYAYEKGSDELSASLKAIRGVAQQSQWGVRHLFRDIFGSGSKPVKFEGQIQYYVPETVTDNYDMAVPLKRPEMLTSRDTYYGYSLQRSRFVYLDTPVKKHDQP